MTADLVARLRECIGNEYMDETARRRLLAIADEMETASALRSSGEAGDESIMCEVAVAPATRFSPGVALSTVVDAIKSRRGTERYAFNAKMDRITAPPTPASAWRPIAEAPADFRDGTFIVTNRLGEVAPMVRGVIQNNTGRSDWTYGEPITEWQPLPPTSTKGG